jgi:glycosyltransferase involved in cell wall biosynthesis
MQKRAIWITWERHRRNDSIAPALGVPLITPRLYERSRVKRYAAGIASTITALIRYRPHVVFCQNPPVLLALLLVKLSFILRFTVIADTHNCGVLPAEGRPGIRSLLARFVHRFARITIVHNERLAPVVERNGGRPFVLQDKFPDIPGTAVRLEGSKNFLLITSWAPDEPIAEFLEAARRIDENIKIYAIGDYRRSAIDPRAVPPNVILTGYISDDRFFALLHSVDAVIDLTKRDNCLVCGAYEGVSAGKPLVLSDTPVLRAYFDRGAVYTVNDAEHIARALGEVLDRKESLSREIAGLRERRDREWESKKAALLRLAGLPEPDSASQS